MYFVKKSQQLYGKEFLVYNVHSLLHLANDAERYGCLDECSAFPFENYMQTLKKMVRSTKNPIVQIERRLHEEQLVGKVYANSSNVQVSTKEPNNAYLLNDNSCCEVTDIQYGNGENQFLCRIYENPEPLFTQPCDSRLIGAVTVLTRNSRMKVIPASALSTKAIRIACGHVKSVFLAILHDI